MGLISKLVSGITLGSPLVAGGAIAGTGGVIGLTHATPRILYNSGLACEAVYGAVTEDELAQLGKSAYVKWPDGRFSGLPWGKIKEGERNSQSCYKLR